MKKILGFGLALLLLLPATAALAQVVAPVVVAATPATAEAVKEAAWWSGLANEMIAALTAVATAAVAAIAPFLLQWIRNRSKLAAVFVTQAMLDKLVLGIQNQIRAEAEIVKQKIPGALDERLSPSLKAEIVARAQPKIETAFKETLQHLNKKPGSSAITDMILGRVDEALVKPVVVPAVVARS